MASGETRRRSGNYCLHVVTILTVSEGIAVSAGEIEEESAVELAETRAQLERALKDLGDAQDENSKLRARLVWMDNDDATIAGTYTESQMRSQ